ncbi:SRPBCC family protein [Mucilaginibacter ginkgonis]|uniref:SRPBCC family protein n=1 Tax=Mucilaginibacter ginkgonis TaxID=2682091 RepID=A0A6I4INW5_9SPHI|nr:SRPBCC family protein [Mucilaginibacter ginkgonis]QQL48554.1 SRPBCC family protein [Mucilaginibacter ginkgonis]
MKTYQLKWEQDMPITLDEAWQFFSSPLNLAKITPKEMGFKITSDYTEDTVMYEGMLISYKITPLLGIKMNWVTEITHIKDRKYFIDEQRFGPYAMWHHEHFFKEIEGGVHMTDKLTYAIAPAPIGGLANALIVRKKVKQIFQYREKAIIERFGNLVM